MRYVFEDREGNQHEFSQPPCESITKDMTEIGVILGGKFMTRNEYDAMIVRVRKTQTEAFDEMLEKKIWSVDDKTQLNMWGVQ